jgi:hypothetical protein
MLQERLLPQPRARLNCRKTGLIDLIGKKAKSVNWKRPICLASDETDSLELSLIDLSSWIRMRPTNGPNLFQT